MPGVHDLSNTQEGGGLKIERCRPAILVWAYRGPTGHMTCVTHAVFVVLPYAAVVSYHNIKFQPAIEVPMTVKILAEMYGATHRDTMTGSILHTLQYVAGSRGPKPGTWATC